MRIAKRLIIGLLAAALSLSMLTACSGSDKITGTAKNWSLSNTGKVLRERESYPWNGEANDVRILRYTTASSEEKYAIVSFGQYQGGAFVGTKTAAYQYGDNHGRNSCRVNFTEKTYKKIDYNHPDLADEWAAYDLLSTEPGDKKYGISWVLAGDNEYNGKMYYTEAFRLPKTYSRQTAYQFVLYYESEDAPQPTYIRITGDGISEMVLNVKEFTAVDDVTDLSEEYRAMISGSTYTTEMKK